MKPFTAPLIRILAVALVFTFCGGPELVQAWSDPAGSPLPDAPSTVAQNAAPQTQSNASEQQQAQPDASQPQTQPAQSQDHTRDQRKPEAPAGAAAAQEGKTAGGPASKPAGAAIAPAKQRQVRSLLLKLGAVAAAGAAIGTVVALTRGTSSVPPGARGR